MILPYARGKTAVFFYTPPLVIIEQDMQADGGKKFRRKETPHVYHAGCVSKISSSQPV